MLKNNWEFYSKLLDKYDTEEEADAILEECDATIKEAMRNLAESF